jgi:hypothetical protein
VKVDKVDRNFVWEKYFENKLMNIYNGGKIFWINLEGTGRS